MTKKYVINMPPIPWKRPARNHKTIYDSQTHEKLAFGLYLRQQHGNQPLYQSPLLVEALFYILPPKSIKKRSAYVTAFPDLDNLLKFVLDAAHDILYDNDKLVCSIQASKLYDMKPRTELTITELI